MANQPEELGAPAATGEHPVVKAELKQALRVNEFKTVGAIVVGSLLTVFGAWRVLLSEAKAQTQSEVSVIAARVTNLEQGRTQTQTDVHEVQMDIRALYRAVMTGASQPRLEAPRDGGP